jgi:hypothetical protein
MGTMCRCRNALEFKAFQNMRDLFAKEPAKSRIFEPAQT